MKHVTKIDMLTLLGMFLLLTHLKNCRILRNKTYKKTIKPRSLMLGGPKVIEHSTVMVSTTPQVNVPNLTLTNNPKASSNSYHYPRVQYPNGTPMNTPKLTMLPPKMVSTDHAQNFRNERGNFQQVRQLSQNPNGNNPIQNQKFVPNRNLTVSPGIQLGAPNMIPPELLKQIGGGKSDGSSQNFDVNKITQQVINNLKKSDNNLEVFNPMAPKKKKKHRHRNRKLFGNGMFNAGPGWVDVGSMPMSSVNLAAANPNISSMGPFIPQVNPPSPIRIRIKDPWTPPKKKKLMSQSRKLMNRVQEDNLIGYISEGLKSLNDALNAFHDQFNEKMKDMTSTENETREHITKTNHSAHLVPELIKEKFGID